MKTKKISTYNKVITRFAGNGKYQLLEHISPCQFYVHRVFESEKEAYVYSAEHNVPMEVSEPISFE